MVTRIAAVLLASSLIPNLAIAQRSGYGGTGTRASSPGAQPGRAAMTTGSRYGHRYGHGHFRGQGGLAPPAGYGNINHPGLGYAPNTPGIGYPLTPSIQPMPTISQPLIGPIRPGAVGFGRPYRYGYPGRYGGYYSYGGYYGAGGVAVVGVPVVVGGYGYPQAPQVIIIQQPADQPQERPRQWPGTIRTEREGENARGLIYETRPAPAREKPAKPLTLLVFKDHSIYAVTEYWKEGDRLCYVTSYGSQNCVSLDLLDLEFTKRLNEERSVKFEL